MKQVGRVLEVPYKPGEKIPTVKQEAPVVPLPESTNPELPSEIDGAARADLVVRPSDLVPSGTPIPEVPLDIMGLIPAQEKQPGIEVTPNAGDRELVIFYKGTQVCWIKYLPGAGLFVIKRRIELDGGNQQVTQYQDRLKEAWRVAGLYGVSPAEFQQAFKDLPPEVNWTFDCCPWGRMDCDLSYSKTDPRTRINPDLLCRKCGCRFSSNHMGNVTLKDPGKDPDGKMNVPLKTARKQEPFIPIEKPREDVVIEVRGETPKPEKKRVSFSYDIMRYRGIGAAKVQVLQDNGFRSWRDIANPENRSKLLGLSGISTNLANFLIEIAEEKE